MAEEQTWEFQCRKCHDIKEKKKCPDSDDIYEYCHTCKDLSYFDRVGIDIPDATFVVEEDYEMKDCDRKMIAEEWLNGDAYLFSCGTPSYH